MARTLIKKLKGCCNLFLLVAAIILPVQLSFAESALVIRGKAAEFDEVVRGMSDDLEGELDIQVITIGSGNDMAQIKKAFSEAKPNIVILLDNKSVNLYADFQKSNKKMEFPPAIATASLFVDKFVGKLKNAVGIRYEVPAVTSAVAMRNILEKPVKKIGVLYRGVMDDIIQQNAKYCKAEGIDLIGVAIDTQGSASSTAKQISDALDKFEDDVDAIWILNDNALFTSKSDKKREIMRTWMVKRQKSKLPAIVGHPNFMTKIPLGSFAIVPDNYGLGAQTAGVIFEIMDNDWEIDSMDVLQPLSVKKFVNVKSLDSKGVDYKKASLNQVDKVIK